MSSSRAIRLNFVFLPVVTLMFLQLGSCSRVVIPPAPPGGVYVSTSAGANFDQSVRIEGKEGQYIATFPLQDVFRSPTASNVLLIAADTQGIVLSENNGETWQVIGSPLKHTNDVVVLENGTIVISGTDAEEQGFVLRSLDKGKSWESVLTIPLPQKGSSIGFLTGTNGDNSDLVALTLDPLDNNHVYAGSNLGTIFSGEQSAKVWRSLYIIKGTAYDPLQLQINSGIRVLAASPFTKGELLVVTRDRRLLKVSSKGQTEISVPEHIGEITPFNVAPARKVYDAMYIPGFANALFVGVENGAVVSRDGGKTWLELNIPIDRSQKFNTLVVAVSPTNSNRLLVAINNVVYRSEDGGTTWNTFALGLPGFTISHISIDPANASHVLVTTVAIKS